MYKKMKRKQSRAEGKSMKWIDAGKRLRKWLETPLDKKEKQMMEILMCVVCVFVCVHTGGARVCVSVQIQPAQHFVPRW